MLNGYRAAQLEARNNERAVARQATYDKRLEQRQQKFDERMKKMVERNEKDLQKRLAKLKERCENRAKFEQLEEKEEEERRLRRKEYYLFDYQSKWDEEEIARKTQESKENPWKPPPKREVQIISVNRVALSKEEIAELRKYVVASLRVIASHLPAAHPHLSPFAALLAIAHACLLISFNKLLGRAGRRSPTKHKPQQQRTMPTRRN
jgi:hypothetical protein